jgi:hypothetical protein
LRQLRNAGDKVALLQSGSNRPVAQDARHHAVVLQKWGELINDDKGCFFFVVLSNMFGEFGVRCTCSVLVGNVDADIYFLYVYIVYISMLCVVFNF